MNRSCFKSVKSNCYVKTLCVALVIVLVFCFCFLKGNDSECTKSDSVLSLWASVMSIIFVFFSIFGMFKLENTQGKMLEMSKEVNKRFKKMKKLEKDGRIQIRLMNLHSRYFVMSNNFSQIEIEAQRMIVLKKIKDTFNEISKKSKDNDSKSILYFLLLGIFDLSESLESRGNKRIIMDFIIEKIDKADTAGKVELLAKTYYMRYNATNVEDDLRKALCAYSFLCNRKDILSCLSLFDDIKELHISLPFDQQVPIQEWKYKLSEMIYIYAKKHADNDKERNDLLMLSSNILNDITRF